MPVVTIRLFPGRSNVIKEFLVRAVSDAVAEIAGTTREGVNVIIDEVAHENWAMGPRLASSRESAPLSNEVRAYVTIGHVSVRSDQHEAYLAWRRDSVFPFMASHDGFLGSTLLTVPDDPNRYVIINKWTSPEASAAYLAKPREAELRVEAREFLTELFAGSMEGRVVDVFHPGRGIPDTPTVPAAIGVGAGID
jgi:4-oxalocrotonate tautomerase family enzyme